MAAPTLIGATYLAAGRQSLADVGDAGLAIVSLEQARRWSPCDPAIYRALAQAHLRLNQPQAAVDALEQAFRLQPGSLLIRQELAQAYEALGQNERAYTIWRSLGVSLPVMLNLGEQARVAKHYPEALSWYERAERLAPESAEPAYYQGLAYRDQGQLDQALDAFLHATQISPDYRDAWYAAGRVYITHKKGDQALEALRRGLDAQTGRAGGAICCIGWAMCNSTCYRRAISRAPGRPMSRRLRSMTSRSIQLLSSRLIIKAVPCSQWRNRWEEAISVYQQVLIANPKHYLAHLSLAQALWQVGQQEAAITQARTAMELEPDRKNAYPILGNFYAAQQDKTTAITMFERALEIDPQDQQVRTWLEALR